MVLYSRLRRDPRWTDIAWVVAGAALAAWGLFTVPVPGLAGALKQRLWLLLIFFETLALRLLRLSKTDLVMRAP